MMPRIAFVGAGPTTLYTLHALLAHNPPPFRLAIYEAQASAGRGTPYRPGWNDPAMLANIASIEIPPLAETLCDWLRRQTPERLADLGVDPGAIGERTFYPRVALGEYFRDQFDAVLDMARARGVDVELRTRCRVEDAVSTPGAMILKIRSRSGERSEETFDQVVLATGHQWPAEPEVRPGYFLSPWPSSALAAVPACSVGIRGSSLTAIDACVALGNVHGSFDEAEDGETHYRPAPATDAFHMTMMSRKGLLPEADFYAPLPYEPLAICTDEAMKDLVASDEDQLLDAAFELFKAELVAGDPRYAASIGLENLDLEGFCEAYFARRAASDPFEWAEANLAEAKRDYAEKHTVAWRYAILRMHEVLALLVPHLDASDYRRFIRHFKPIFVDDYATVPHKSIRRLIALHRAGKLDVAAIGDDYRIDTSGDEAGATLVLGGERRYFPIFIEAMGQRPLGAAAFPFPSLRRQGIVRDAALEAGKGDMRGIAIDEEFHPLADDAPEDRLFCLSLPFLLGRHPFIQGITSSHEMGLVVGEQLAAVVAEAQAEQAAA
ncbi:FAD/NAD(P)-binding protein [Sphingopyxis sp. KK2]|uniref:FAD/NAD(P)-binding protein n=1 Tax=Sphingopyxis sp. KK2 TaxID=1855727 RepID=UPI0009FAA446|nr:FAD/NAD(P)-binding protein [Sphingopyxis sp. KK2]